MPLVFLNIANATEKLMMKMIANIDHCKLSSMHSIRVHGLCSRAIVSTARNYTCPK